VEGVDEQCALVVQATHLPVPVSQAGVGAAHWLSIVHAEHTLFTQIGFVGSLQLLLARHCTHMSVAGLHFGVGAMHAAHVEPHAASVLQKLHPVFPHTTGSEPRSDSVVPVPVLSELMRRLSADEPQTSRIGVLLVTPSIASALDGPRGMAQSMK
jgi:hypothetical protein